MFASEEGVGGSEGWILMRWLRMEEEREMYPLGSARGEGAGFEVGHSNV